MPKKNLIAVIVMVVSLIAASLTLVFTVGINNVDAANPVLFPSQYFKINAGVLSGITPDGFDWVKNHSNFDVVIPNTATCIAYGAFNNVIVSGRRTWSGLKSITIPDTVTSIETGAFTRIDLSSITIPKSVTNIEEGAFESCCFSTIQVDSQNTKYTSGNNNNCIIDIANKKLILGCNKTIIPDDGSVESIGQGAFTRASISNLLIPNTVTSIGKWAFDRCFYGGKIYIPSSVTYIGERAFYDCICDVCAEAPSKPSTWDYSFLYDMDSRSHVYYGCHKVEFNRGEGNTTWAVAYNGGSVTEPLAPTKDGQVFKYWYYEDETVSFDFSSIITENITLNAKWADAWQVTFDSDGGSAVDIQQVEKNTFATMPTTNPTKTDYKFLYWHLENEDEPFDFANTPITDNITLYAKWNPIYTVTFYMNGGSADYSSAKVENGYYATKPTTNPTKTGYTFRYWYAENEDEPFDFEHTEITANITLNAKWQINTYTVTFVTDGGTLTGETTQPVEYNNRLTTLPTAEWEGHVFKKWVDQNQHEFTLNTPVEENLTVSAVWVDLWTVTFNTNGGTEVADQFVENGNRAQWPYEPTKENFFFNGWYADENCTTGFSFNTPITQNTTIYAGWWPKYYVTFVYNNGDEDYIVEVGEDDTVGEEYVNNRIGYDFAGWFDTEGNEFNFSTPIRGNITLIAHWTPKSYTITFNSNGGSAVAKQKVNYGDKVTRPTDPTLPGYTFVGWNYNNKLYNFNTTVTKAITLKAKWEVREYTVTYNTNGGNTIPSVFGLGYGDKVEKPADPIKDGYTFKGWYIDASYTTEFDFNTGITDDITIYAKWEAIPAQVNVAAIAGGTAGGAVGLGTLGTLFGFAIRKKRRLK